MGRYAQARRRGNSSGSGAPPGAPPAPVISIDDGHLQSHAQGLDDGGGHIILYYDATGSGEWVPIANPNWARTVDHGVTGTLDPGFYRSTETGNGTVYVGESAPSNFEEIT